MSSISSSRSGSTIAPMRMVACRAPQAPAITPCVRLVIFVTSSRYDIHHHGMMNIARACARVLGPAPVRRHAQASCPRRPPWATEWILGDLAIPSRRLFSPND
jgi:hypothetical protein